MGKKVLLGLVLAGASLVMIGLVVGNLWWLGLIGCILFLVVDLGLSVFFISEISKPTREIKYINDSLEQLSELLGEPQNESTLGHDAENKAHSPPKEEGAPVVDESGLKHRNRPS